MFGFFKKPQKEQMQDKVANLSIDDTTLEDYKNKAQEGIQYLIDFMNSHDKDNELFKYAVKTNFIEEGKSEHMWVQVNEFSGHYFSGKLANKPNTIKALKYGDEVKVGLVDIEDWILQDLLTATKVGGFSSDYIRKKSNQI